MPDAAIIIDIIAWGVGAGIIALFSWNFFNAGDYFLDSPSTSLLGNKEKLVFTEPLLPIFATSRWRYRKWFLVFLASTISVYILVAFALDKPLDNSNKLEWYRAYNQVFAALLVSGLVNILPKQLQFLDLLRWLRNVTHRRAKIPERALSIFRNIMNFELNISDNHIQNAIVFIGKDYLDESDFAPAENPINQNTIEKNWSKTCHLLSRIHNMSSVANSRYANNLSRTELVYDQAQCNFDNIKDDIKSYKSNKTDVSIESLTERTRLLLKQFSKLTVCLVFASETKEEDIYRKLQGIGVNLRKRIKYELNISFIAISMLGFALLSLVSVYSLAIFLKTEQPISSNQAVFISLAAVLIICCPIMITFFIKTMSPDVWPVRGQFSPRQSTPPITILFLGIGVGLLGFYVTSLTGLFKDMAWYTFWPYTFMSGLISALAAVTIDSRPRIWDTASAIFRAGKWGITAAFCFVVIAVMSIITVYDIQLERGQILAALSGKSFTLWLSGIIGFFSGLLMSLLAEYSARIQSQKDELHLNLSEYLLPKLGYENVSHFNQQELNKRFTEVRTELSDSFVSYLIQNNFIAKDETMPEKSITQLKFGLSKPRETVIS